MHALGQAFILIILRYRFFLFKKFFSQIYFINSIRKVRENVSARFDATRRNIS